MPVVKMNKVGKESTVAIWLISEMEQELSFLVQEACPEEIVSPLKRLEWLSGRALLKTVLEERGLKYYGLRKDEFGKPFLKEYDYQISISNSYPNVAVQIHSNQPVGIDLEQPKDKLLRIAHRVLSPIEVENAGDDITKHCVYWCAKEAMYKLYGKRGLHFENQLNLAPFLLEKNGLLKGKINATDLQKEVSLAYVIESEYVMVYTNFEE